MENSNPINSSSPLLLLLSPKDNVMVTVCSLDAGTTIEINSITITLNESLGLGQKIAAHDLAEGEKIIKYGVSIGSTTTDVQVGEPVHLHNMKSDYLPTYDRGETL